MTLIKAVIFEILLVNFLVYVPYLNNFLLFTSVSPKHACTGLWMLPIIIAYDEFRKF